MSKHFFNFDNIYNIFGDVWPGFGELVLSPRKAHREFGNKQHDFWTSCAPIYLSVTQLKNFGKKSILACVAVYGSGGEGGVGGLAVAHKL